MSTIQNMINVVGLLFRDLYNMMIINFRWVIRIHCMIICLARWCGSGFWFPHTDWGVIGDRDQLVDTIFVAGCVVRRTRSSAAVRRRTFNKARSVGLTMRHLGVYLINNQCYLFTFAAHRGGVEGRRMRSCCHLSVTIEKVFQKWSSDH